MWESRSKRLEEAERNRIQAARDPAWNIHSQSWFGVQCPVQVLVNSAFLNPRLTQQSTRCFRGLHGSFCWGSVWRCRSHLPRGPGPCPYCQKHQNLVWCPCHQSAWLASQLSRPQTHLESMGYCQEENEGYQTQKNQGYQTQKQIRTDSKHQVTLGFHNSRPMPQAESNGGSDYGK